MLIGFRMITNFFSGEEKLIEQGENALKFNGLINFTYNGTMPLN